MRATFTRIIRYVLFAIFIMVMIGCDTGIEGGFPIDNIPLTNTPAGDMSPASAEPRNTQPVDYLLLLNQIADGMSVVTSATVPGALSVIRDYHSDVQVTWSTENPMVDLTDPSTIRLAYSDDNAPTAVELIADLRAETVGITRSINVTMTPVCNIDQVSFCDIEAGTAQDPYSVYNLAQLQAVSGNLLAHYVQRSDIDGSPTADWNDIGTDTTTMEGFFPIGSQGFDFQGSYDGSYFTISDLTIDRSDTEGVGLFGWLANGAVVSRVSMTGLYYTGLNRIGGLVGYSAGLITDSGVEGTLVINGDDGGGLVGFLSNTVTDSEASINIHIESSNQISSNIGGLVGSTAQLNGVNATIERSRAYEMEGSIGQVQGHSAIGGLVGHARDVNISDSYTAIPVLGAVQNVGGLIGLADNSIVRNAYVTGFVLAIPGATNIGGMVGSGSGTIFESSYWDTQTTNQSNSAYGSPRTTAQLQCPRHPGQVCESGIAYQGWSDGIWDFGTSFEYPTLLRHNNLID